MFLRLLPILLALASGGLLVTSMFRGGPSGPYFMAGLALTNLATAVLVLNRSRRHVPPSS